MGIQNVIPASAPDLLTATEIAGYLDVSIMCIHRWAKAGKMPAPIRLTWRHVRWQKAEIIEWVKRCKRISTFCPVAPPAEELAEAATL